MTFYTDVSEQFVTGDFQNNRQESNHGKDFLNMGCVHNLRVFG